MFSATKLGIPTLATQSSVCPSVRTYNTFFFVEGTYLVPIIHFLFVKEVPTIHIELYL